MKRMLLLLVPAMFLVSCGGPAASPTPESVTIAPTSPSETRQEGWAADLRQLITFREQVHPEPWHGISRDDYLAEVENVISRIDQLSDDQLLVEITRLAAMPTWAGRDGHGGMYPWGEGSYGTNLYPLRLYWFSDGLFVVGALAPYQHLTGLRVEAMAGHSVEELLAAVEPLVPRDNHMQVLTHSPRLVVVSELLHGLGFLAEANLPIEVTFSRDGVPSVETIYPVPLVRFENAIGGHHTHSPPQDPEGPRWLRDYHKAAWWELDIESRTAYIAYNFTSAAVGAAVAEVRQHIAAGEVDRLVVDVRHNPGGDNTSYHSLLNLVREAAVELPKGAYVIIGRATFSAAGNFVTDVERNTEAILIGEDSGTSPNQYGDSFATQLDYSGLVFRVGRYLVTRSTPDDSRVTVEPDIEVLLSSADYFAGIDPVWEAILAHR